MELIIILLIISLAWVDAEHLDRLQWYNSHISRGVSRGLICLIISCFDLYLGVYTILMFFGLFDFSLNIIRKDVKWNHIGGESIMDLFFQKHKWLYLSSKFAVLIFCFSYKLIVWLSI